MQELVLASHLALVNVYLALEADKDPVPKQNMEPPSDREIDEHNQQLTRTKQHVLDMASSRADYIRAVGYHELFGLEPPKQEVRSAEDIRKAEREEAYARNQRLIASLRATASAGVTGFG